MIRRWTFLAGVLFLVAVGVGLWGAHAFGMWTGRTDAPQEATTDLRAGAQEGMGGLMAYPAAQELMGVAGELTLIGPEFAPDLPGEYVDLPQRGIKVRVPEWWRPVDGQEFSEGPYHFADVRAAFTRDNSSCALIYSADASAPYVRAHDINPVIMGNQNRVPGEGMELYTRRNVLREHIPLNPATTTPGIVPYANGLHELYWPYEFVTVVPNGTTPLGFHLVSTDGTPLTPACESEMRSIVQTMARSVTIGTLPVDGNGLIAIATDSVVTSRDQMYLFAPNYSASRDDGFFVMQMLPKDAEQFVFSERDQSVYFVRNNEHPGVYQLSLRAADSAVPPKKVPDELDVPAGEIIASFLIHGSQLYYLTGQATCHEYMGTCTTELRVRDLVSGTSRVIASNLQRSSVVGVASDASDILLATYHGDAGCWSYTYDQVALTDGAVTSAGTFSGCYNDDGTLEDPAQERGKDRLVERFNAPNPMSVYALSYARDSVAPYIEEETTPWGDRATAHLMNRYQVSLLPIGIMR